MIARILLRTGVLAALAAASGCRQCPERFVSQEVLLEEYNANARRVPRLWARARIRAGLASEGGLGLTWGSTSPLAPANGYLMLSKDAPAKDAPPGEPARPSFVLLGREVGTDLFRLGLDARAGRYYFWYSLGREGHAWHGRQEYAGAPDVQAMPVDPTQLVEVLGVTELPDRPGTLPAAAMTLQTDPCAYVVCCLKPQPVSGRMRIWRKVYFRWSDDLPRRPYLVELFDADGRLRVVAHLAAYGAVAADAQEANPPVMPTDIRLTWPAIRDVQPGGTIHLVLSEMSAVRDFDASVLRFALPAGVPATPVDSSHGPIEQERPGR